MPNIYPLQEFKQYQSFYPYYLPSYYANYYPRSFQKYYYEPRLTVGIAERHMRQNPKPRTLWVLIIIALVGLYLLFRSR